MPSARSQKQESPSDPTTETAKPPPSAKRSPTLPVPTPLCPVSNHHQVPLPCVKVLARPSLHGEPTTNIFWVHLTSTDGRVITSATIVFYRSTTNPGRTSRCTLLNHSALPCKAKLAVGGQKTSKQLVSYGCVKAR